MIGRLFFKAWPGWSFQGGSAAEVEAGSCPNLYLKKTSTLKIVLADPASASLKAKSETWLPLFSAFKIRDRFLDTGKYNIEQEISLTEHNNTLKNSITEDSQEEQAPS